MECNDEKIFEDELKKKITEILMHVSIKNVIIDFSCINYIDSMGVNAILQVSPNKIYFSMKNFFLIQILKLNETFNEIGVTLSLTYCKSKLLTFIFILF